MALAAAILTHSGMSVLVWNPPATRARTITPIVFWASCSPWPSAIAAAERVCAIRNRRVTLCGFAFRNAHSSPTMSRKARPKPTSGEATIGMTTLSRMTCQCTVTPATTPTPVSAPIRACDDEDGRPFHQVMRFQQIAPITAASTMIRPLVAAIPVSADRSMIPDPIVLATSVPSSAPSRLNAAAMSSARRGVRALVETEVAIALAASWNPLV